MSVLETKSLTKIYGSKGKGLIVKALDEFNMQIEEGEFVGIMGPSGSGKTTLLNILATSTCQHPNKIYCILLRERKKRLGRMFESVIKADFEFRCTG